MLFLLFIIILKSDKCKNNTSTSRTTSFLHFAFDMFVNHPELSFMASNNKNLQPKDAPFLRGALRYGVIGGLIGIGLHLISFMFLRAPTLRDPTFPFVAFTFIGFFRYVVVGIIMVVIAVRKHRDVDLGGYISGERCVTIGMIVIVTIHAVYLLWYFVLYKFIESGIFKEFSALIYTTYTFYYVFIFGIIVSLAISSVMKK